MYWHAINRMGRWQNGDCHIALHNGTAYVAYWHDCRNCEHDKLFVLEKVTAAGRDVVGRRKTMESACALAVDDAGKRQSCDICKAEVKEFKRTCDGDGRVHHHGAIHTILRGSTNDLALVGKDCGCGEKDARGWNLRRGA